MAGIKRTAADNWFSLYVRARDKWTCQRCHKKFPAYVEGGSNRELQGLDCCHFHGRSTKMTRLEPDNAVSMCYGCHSYMDGHPLEFVEFMINRLGQERIDELEVLRHKPFLNFKKEEKRLSEHFRQLFRELNKK